MTTKRENIMNRVARTLRVGIFSVSILHFSFSTVHAQLKSVGEVPADLKMSTMELYRSDVERAKKYTGGKVRDQQSLQEAAYHVNKMMASGRIVYGDPISVMAGRIADTLLKDYPELRSELRFYTVKSPEVNAFATGQGMVFINAGLVAQSENEAQLAFIISHEIIHYYRSHTMEELVGKDGKKRDSDKERAELSQFIKKHNRSREMENEADSLGVAMFYLKSPYSKDVSESVFDVLQYSALPFDDVPFDTTYFNTPYYQLNGCWLDKTAEITSRDDYDDSRSTHPNILSRRRKMAQALDGYYGGEEFVMTTRDEYMAIRELARNECIRQELIGGEYSRAFYNAWLMDREQRAKGQPSEMTAEYLAQALYGVTMFKNHNGTNSVTGDYEKIEGESQQVYYAMRRITNEQLTLAVLHKIWNLHKQYPKNKAFASMCSNLMDELHTTHRLALSLFADKPPVTTSDTVVQQEEDKHLSKYERIKQKRQNQNLQGTYVYALTDLQMSDSLFNSEMREHFAVNAADTTIDSTASEGGVFIYSTSYWVVGTKDNRLKIDKCQRGEQDLAEQVIKAGKCFGRDAVDFSDRGLHQMETAEQYNDFVVLNEWVNEFWQNKGQFNLHRLTQPDMDSLIERYDASIVSVNALLNVEDIHHPHSTITASILLVPFIPIFVYDEIFNSERTAMVTMLIDAAKGRMLSRKNYEAEMADNSATVGSMLYDSYNNAFKGKSTTGVMGQRVAIIGGVQLALPGYNSLPKIATFTPWASAEVALNGKSTLGVGWSHIGAFDEYNTEIRQEWVSTNGGYSGHWVNNTYSNLDYSKAMTTWSLTYRHYSNGFAPMGPNFGIGATMVHFTNPSDGSSGGNSYGIHLAGGVNHVFFRYLVLNLEARYGLTTGLFKALPYNTPNSEYYKIDGLLHNLIQLRIGIGVLPF